MFVRRSRALCTSRKERFKKVLVKLFQKLVGSQGDALRRTPQSAKHPHRSKNAGEGEFLCEAKEEGEPSSGVLLYLWLVCVLSHYNINRHSIVFSFDTRGAKEKASQKEKRRFSLSLFEKSSAKTFLNRSLRDVQSARPL